ncbi:MAG TPA: hypothetical protein VNH83_08275 [Bryobacteraceae bacterium]|nr:hypothetical protein [Bryobacteraceae bacterium]
MCTAVSDRIVAGRWNDVSGCYYCRHPCLYGPGRNVFSGPAVFRFARSDQRATAVRSRRQRTDSGGPSRGPAGRNRPLHRAAQCPGLFFQLVGAKAYLVALHADGSLVTLKSPAHRGEKITALGTGFGPYQVQPLDGFAVPHTGSDKLADHTQLIFEGKAIEPEFAAGAAGRVGVVAICFHIADPLPAAATIEIKARVHGHDSNTVLLPLE